jgi:hypothetical protein
VFVGSNPTLSATRPHQVLKRRHPLPRVDRAAAVAAQSALMIRCRASAREAQPLRLKLFFFSRDADGTVDERTRLVDPQVELLRDVPATVGAELVIGVEARLPL